MPTAKKKNYAVIDYENQDTIIFHSFDAIQAHIEERCSQSCRDLVWVEQNFAVYEIKEFIPISASVKTVVKFGLG
jgi:hypothetical protein